jgi:hypothetical protein
MVTIADDTVIAEASRFQPEFVHVCANLGFTIPSQFVVRTIGAVP